MDEVGVVRIREGRMEAQKPAILRPDGYESLLFEGFGEQAEEFAEWFQENGNLKFLSYGFNFTKKYLTESTAHEPLEAVQERVLDDIRQKGDPSRAVIVGMDDSWEISLLKFTMDIISQSLNINVFDFQRRGLL